MNRDETVALFLECEAKRAEAREAALAAGKSEGDAYAAAHEAAKAHWKAWAEPLLAERKAMEADGRWAAEKDWRGSLEAKNEDTRAWMAKAGVIFSRCLFLVRGGEGTKETAGEDKEESEGGTPPVKSIQLEGDRIDFDGFVFPSNARFESATFTGDASFDSATFTGNASFASATFTGNARFESATFTGYAWFESATFTGNASFASATFTGYARFDSATFTGDARFASATFTGDASFASATFTGNARFASATFTGNASFESATFTGNARFASATFTGNASFESATFTGYARFDSATFTGDARFASATFTGDAWFESATFTGDASFDSATFTGNARFASATFTGYAWFESATFTGNASFESATFTGNASFDSATFTGYASFDSATFTGNASFASATFTGDAWFASATFTGNAWFASATFTGYASFDSATFTGNAGFQETQLKRDASFALASFKQHAKFASARFEASASFYAIRGERGFDMAGAVFEAVPDFIQAHFEEAPRLDNLKVYGCWIERHPRPEREKAKTRSRRGWHAVRHAGGGVRTWPARAAKGGWRRMRTGNSNIPARWRALKRLAIQGHDTERELEYHARELQSQRFEDDWPLPFRFWSPASWVGALRFWFGMFYGLFSDFGRSTVRPALLWFATVAVFAMYFLAGQPYVMERWQPAEPQGSGSSVVAYVKLIPSLWSAPPPCYAGMAGKDDKPSELTGLVEPVIGSTNTLREAIRLAFRNGSVILDGGEDALHRTYGCLYGIERYNGNPVPFVPGFVTDASGLQKVLSALYIFLFGLALRNMLKMK